MSTKEEIKQQLDHSIPFSQAELDAVPRMKYSEAKKQAEEFADKLLNDLDNHNKTVYGSKPLVIAECPECHTDISKWYLRKQLVENYHKALARKYVVLPDHIVENI